MLDASDAPYLQNLVTYGSAPARTTKTMMTLPPLTAIRLSMVKFEGKVQVLANVSRTGPLGSCPPSAYPGTLSPVCLTSSMAHVLRLERSIL